jgi:hypothetical protein
MAAPSCYTASMSTPFIEMKRRCMAEDAREKTPAADNDPMETAKRIMKRLAETPHSPHQPLGKRPSKKASPTPKSKD